MSNYEAVFMLNTKLEEAALADLKNSLKTTMEGVGAQNLVEVSCDRRGLTFSIRKQTEAYYLIYRFAGPGDSVGKLRTDLKHREEILRMSFLRIPEKAVSEPETISTTEVAPTPIEETPPLAPEPADGPASPPQAAREAPPVEPPESGIGG